MQTQHGLDSITDDQLKSFLRLCTFGTMETDGTLLTNEEQQHLFSMLEKIHNTKNVDARGIWAIISLTFQNRSGLILMSLFNNSNIKTKELLRSKFLRNIQMLQNPEINISKLRKILQVLGIQQYLFMQKFKESKDIMTHATQHFTRGKKKLVTIPEQKLFPENYDSDPQTHHYVKMMLLDQQSTINRRFSVVYNRNSFQFLQSDYQQQETITMKRNMRGQTKNKRRKKKVKRPQPKKKRQTMMKKAKNVNAESIKFTNDRRQKQKLMKTYKMMHLAQQQPSTPRKQPQNPSNYQTTPNEMQNQSPSNPQQQQNNFQFRLQRQQQNTANKNKRLRKGGKTKIVIIQEQQKHSINQFEQQQAQSYLDDYMIDQNQIYNESIQHLQIKKIYFPCTIEDLRRNNVIKQNQFQEFLFSQWREYLSVLNDKQQRNQIKGFLKQKANIQFQNIVKVLSMVEDPIMNRFYKPYLKPLLIYKFTKMFANIINQIISVLYSSGSLFPTLSGSCKTLIILCQQFYKDQNKTFNNVIFETMQQLIQYEFPQKQTDSMVSLPNASQIIKQAVRIKIKQEEAMNQSIVTAIFIFIYVFMSKLSKQLKLASFQTRLSLIKKKIPDVLLIKIKQKTRILKYICEIYTQFQLPISTKQQFQEVVSLFKQIDLGIDYPQQFYRLIPNLTREFIKQKIKKDERFNYKPMINYIIISTQIVQKCYKRKQQKPNFLLLLIFSVMMQFQQFHEDMTINQALNFIKDSIKIQSPHSEQFNIVLLRLLIKCYSIKKNHIIKQILKNKAQSINNYREIVKNQLKNKSQLMRKLQEFILQYLNCFVKKFTRVLIAKNKVCQISANQKLEKYQKILTIFFQDFIVNKLIQSSLSHYLFTVALLIKLTQSLIKSNETFKQNSFLIDIYQLIIKQLYRVDDVWQSFNSLFDQTQQQDVADFFFQCKEQKKKYLIQIRSLIVQKINKISNTNSIIALSEMRQPRHKLVYQIQGIITAFTMLSRSSPNRNKQLQYHTKQIKIVKSQSQLQSTTNTLVIYYIKGLLKIFNIYCLKQSQNKLQIWTKENILDIIFISFLCNSSLQNRQQLHQLLNIISKIPEYKGVTHLLTKYKISHQASSSYYLQQYYKSILQKTNALQKSMISKFKTVYLQIIKKLWQEYRDVKWHKQEGLLAFNLLITFKFLLTLHETSQDIIKAFKDYFIITDSKFSQNNSTLNMLKSIQLKQPTLSNHIGIQRYVLELFWLIEDKNKSLLKDTKKIYVGYIVDITLKSKQSSERAEYRYNNIRKFIQALNNQCRKKQQSLDGFTLQLGKQILNNFLSMAFRNEEHRQSSTYFFLTLFKTYPQLNEVYMTSLKLFHQRMDHAIRSMKSRQLQSCQNIQDAILKYIIGDFCDFKNLFNIIQQRNSKNKDKYILQQIKAIIKKCIRYLEKINKNNELTQKYKQLQNSLNIEQEDLNNYNYKNNFQKYMASHKFS